MLQLLRKRLLLTHVRQVQKAQYHTIVYKKTENTIMYIFTKCVMILNVEISPDGQNWGGATLLFKPNNPSNISPIFNQCIIWMYVRTVANFETTCQVEIFLGVAVCTTAPAVTLSSTMQLWFQNIIYKI